MNTLGEISVIGEQTLGKILNEGKLRVPSNQREFSWKESHVRELFQDVQTVIDDGEGNEYFFGTIVVLRHADQGGTWRIVVDGQQRLATTAIFLAAVRDYFFYAKDDQGVVAIEPEYLLKTTLPERMPIAQFRLNDGDHSYFENRVLHKPDSEPRKEAARRTVKQLRPSHRLISAAAELAAEQVSKIVRDRKPEDREKQLMKWVQFFHSQARVIMVTVQDESTAYTVFETMNDRGLELSAIDLIKNKLFSLSKQKLEDTKHNWSRMLTTLETVQSSTIVKDYVRHYWISKNGRTRAPVLFKAVSDEVNNSKRAVAFAEELAANAGAYVALLDPGNDAWSKYRPLIREYVAALKVLDVKQIRPLLLSVARTFPKNEVPKAFALVVSWCVRLMAADQLGRGSLESEYSDAAQSVHEKKITTASQLATTLKSIIPDDNKFASDFSLFTVADEGHARYLLRILELTETGQTIGGVTPKRETTLEHVLPKQPKNLNDWPFTQEEHQEYVYRLGNQALMPNQSNSEMGSDKFAIKKQILSKQPNLLTKEIAQEADWGKRQIETRQARLSKIAVRAWSLNP
jgi:hypothetical protein